MLLISAHLQWLFHSGERAVARVPLDFTFTFIPFVGRFSMNGGDMECSAFINHFKESFLFDFISSSFTFSSFRLSFTRLSRSR